MDLNFDEMREMREIEHRNKMKEISFQSRVDKKLEDVKAENARKLEEQKAKNASKIEVKKIVGAIGKGVVMAGVWFGLTCLADRIEVPRRNVPREK